MRFAAKMIKKGGAVAQSVKRATLDEELPGSITAVVARSLLVGLVSCQYNVTA